MKTRMKRLISLVCVLTVFASTVLSVNFLSAKADANSSQVETLPTDMTEITFRDFGYADGAYKAFPAAKQYGGTTMDNTLFGGMVTFPKNKDVYIQYGGKVAGGGFNLGTSEKDGEWYLRLYDTNKDKSGQAFSVDLHADVAGVDTFVEEELELHISIEYVDHDNGGTQNDMKLGVWFNKKLYNNAYVYVNNYLDKTHCIGTYMGFYVSSKTSITVKSLDYKLPTDMTAINFTDFDIADGSYSNTISGTYSGETMDKTLFSGKLTFSETGETHFMYGGTEAWGGFILTNVYDTTNQEYYLRLYDSNKDNVSGKKFNDVKFYADKAGVQNFVGEEFKLNYTIEYVNNDNGATKNDLKLGVWFNNKLYENQYIYINNYVDNGHSLGTVMTVWNRNGATIELKSANYQLPENMTNISFRDFGIADGEYTKWKGQTYSGETMDNTLFGGTITFPKVVGAQLSYAGKENYTGLELVVGQNSTTQEWYLRLRENKNKAFKEMNLYSDIAGVELVGVPLELNISLEYVNIDEGTTDNDVKLGVWFGGKLYNDEYIYIKDFVDASNAIGKWLTYVPKTDGPIYIKSSDYKLPTDMTEISFRDFGFADGTLTAAINKGEYEAETMNKTLFRGNITYSTVGTSHLAYGGKGSLQGFLLSNVKNASTGEHYLRLWDSNADQSGKKFNDYNFYEAEAGVPLVGTKLDLGISMEYVNNDNGQIANDLKLGVWFGGKLYKNEYIYINNYVDTGHSVGQFMTIWNQAQGATVAIESVGEINWKPMPGDMTEITFRDFGFVDGTLTAALNRGEYEAETMNKTLFRGNVTYSTAGTSHIAYGGKGSLQGFLLSNVKNASTGEHYLRLWDSNADKNGKKFDDIYFYSDVAGVQLVGTKLDLAITMEYVNHDNGQTANDLKLGVWFGGKLYNNAYIYINNYVDTGHSVGQFMTVWNQEQGATVAVESIGAIDWKPMPEGMTEITFRDFGFVDGDITQYPTGEYEGTTLDNTLFTGKIIFPESTAAHIMYGGKVGGGGFDIVPAQDTTTNEWYLRLFDTNHDKAGKTFNEYKFYEDVAGVALVGEELDLSLSIQYVDHDQDGVKDDVKLGVWFAGKLYNNNYIYLDNFADTGHSMGTWMAFSVVSTTQINIKSVGEINWKPMPEGMTEITFRDFGFVDGDLTQYPTGQYEGKTLDNTLFTGKITFPESAAAHIMYGGKVGGGGFDIVPAQDETTGQWYLRLFDTNHDKTGKKFNEYKFYEDVAGVALVGEELELSLSLEYVDHDKDGAKDDVKLGVWFAGKLYNNNYIYLDNFADTGHSMGTWMAFSVAKTTKINVKSVGTINWKDVPEGLTEITFRDFGFIDGGITQYPSGEYEGKTLDNTLFTGKITFPESAAAHIMYGGKIAGGGFDIVPAQNETTGEWYLRLFDTNRDKTGRKFSEYKFYADVAGMKLVGEEIAISFSLQYVDHDQDGQKDDVKLGVWFGGKLYNNRYIYLDGFADTGHSMGTWMAFSVAKTTKINIKSVGEINWKQLPTGFTEIGFDDFGFKAGSYEGGLKSGNCELESMDKTLFSGVIMYSTEGETHFTYGGKKSLSGLDFVNVKDEKTGEHYLRLFDTNADKKGKKFNDMYFYSDVAGVTLVGEELDLKLSMEYVNHDGGKTNNDLKLGVWFAGKLYNNRYIYIDNYVDNSHSIGSYMTVWVRNGAVFNVGRISDWLNWSAFGLTANWQKTLLDTDFNLEYALAGGNPYTGDKTQFPYSMMIASLVVIILCGCQIVRRRRNGYDLW